MKKSDLLREIPSVDLLLKEEEFGVLKDVPRTLVVETVREQLALLRQSIIEGTRQTFSQAEIVRECIDKINQKLSPNLRYVINATGVVLHTNLGRAVLSTVARRAMNQVAMGYSNLEYELEEGVRGTRYSHTSEIIQMLTGAEASLVVNNNAAAVLLVLNTLAEGREVVVSRGELVEIGGGFRVPEVMARGGARLIEVGTTNKTRIKDYERAVTGETAALLKVHTSNFRIVGFTHSVTLAELRGLANKCRIPLIEDLGSGSLVETALNGMVPEPTVQQSLEAGADIITFSGDKLLGGPQAGIIVGRREYISRIEANPLTRALRVDKVTLAALEATLRQYLDINKALKDIPALEMLHREIPELEQMAARLLSKLGEGLPAVIEIDEDCTFAGGGALPGVELPTVVAAIKPLVMSVDCLAKKMRTGRIPVVGRIQNDRFLLDLRTVQETEMDDLAAAVRAAFATGGDEVS